MKSVKHKPIFFKEEISMNNEEKVTPSVEEPEWGVLMFWEDITALLKKIGEIIESIINAISGK